MYTSGCNPKTKKELKEMVAAGHNIHNHNFSGNSQILTGSAIQLYRLNVLAKGLKLECLGMTRRGRSIYSIVKEEFKLKGSKREVYEQFLKLVEETRQAAIVEDK